VAARPLCSRNAEARSGQNNCWIFTRTKTHPRYPWTTIRHPQANQDTKKMSGGPRSPTQHRHRQAAPAAIDRREHARSRRRRGAEEAKLQVLSGAVLQAGGRAQKALTTLGRPGCEWPRSRAAPRPTTRARRQRQVSTTSRYVNGTPIGAQATRLFRQRLIQLRRQDEVSS